MSQSSLPGQHPLVDLGEDLGHDLDEDLGEELIEDLGHDLNEDLGEDICVFFARILVVVLMGILA